jgi:hypothetical protein
MIGLKVRLIPLPEQPGEARVSAHWFFLPAALFYIAGGLAFWRYHHVYCGWACVCLGLMPLLAFVLCLRRGPSETLFTVRARPLILVGVMASYMFLYIVIFHSITAKWAWTFPFLLLLWPLSGGLIWNSIVRHFLKHPPKYRLPKL